MNSQRKLQWQCQTSLTCLLDSIVTLQRRLTTVCTICNGPSASHLHYGAVACYSCRAFFRRGIGKPYCCVEGTGDCGIDWTNRRSCQWCRFDRSGETIDADSKTSYESYSSL